MIQTGIFTYILKKFLEQTRTLIRANKSQSQELLIKKLSCLIRQWWFFLNYYPLYSDNVSAALFEKKTRERSRSRKDKGGQNQDPLGKKMEEKNTTLQRACFAAPRKKNEKKNTRVGGFFPLGKKRAKVLKKSFSFDFELKVEHFLKPFINIYKGQNQKPRSYVKNTKDKTKADRMFLTPLLKKESSK